MGRLEEALDKFHGLSLQPEDCDPLYRLHDAFAQRDDFDFAIDALDMITQSGRPLIGTSESEYAKLKNA